MSPRFQPVFAACAPAGLARRLLALLALPFMVLGLTLPLAGCDEDLESAIIGRWSIVNPGGGIINSRIHFERSGRVTVEQSQTTPSGMVNQDQFGTYEFIRHNTIRMSLTSRQTGQTVEKEVKLHMLDDRLSLTTTRGSVLYEPD